MVSRINLPELRASLAQRWPVVVQLGVLAVVLVLSLGALAPTQPARLTVLVPRQATPVPVSSEVIAMPVGTAQKIAAAMPAAPPTRRHAERKAKPGPVVVDINHATLAQWETLPRVGPKMAQRIVDYRRQQGGFKAIEDLLEVKGIGDKTLAKMRPYLRLNGT
ncbi:MAG: ComEA family DNA-binding protein [Candidatus Melainabacteria bacterium]